MRRLTHGFILRGSRPQERFEHAMANFIPQEIIDTIMQRADILEIVGEYVQLKRQGRNWFGLCPFHHEDTPSFSVNPEKQIFKCFGCGKGGNSIGFVQEVEHLSFTEAVQKLADRYAVAIPEKALNPAEQRRQAERQAILAAHAQSASFYAQQRQTSATAAAYAKKRGLEEAVCQRFSLGMAPEEDWQALYHNLHQAGYGDELLIKAGLISRSTKNGRCYDKFHGRLIFPICDPRGAVIAFGGRALGEEQPKYLNSQSTPIYNKSNCLYALHLAAEAIRSSRQVVIMEGYMDVLTAHQFGVTNAVAALGTAFTSEQARLLRRYAPEAPARLQMILAFDGDSAGEKAARASLEKLSEFEFIEPRVLVFPEQLDPDEFLKKYGLKGWRRLLEHYCYPALDYLLRKALEKHDASSAAGKGAIVTELLPALRKVKNHTERASFVSQLARKLQVSEQAIQADLASGRNSAAATLALKKPPAQQHTGLPHHPASRQLLLLAISDPAVFDKAQKELGEHFASTPEEQALIDLIAQLGPHYDFHPSSLFNYLSEENEGLRNFLLKLLETDSDGASADAYIRTIRQHHLSEKIALLQQQISEAEQNHEDSIALLQEKMRLLEEAKQL